jgi:hypothetical protein
MEGEAVVATSGWLPLWWVPGPCGPWMSAWGLGGLAVAGNGNNGAGRGPCGLGRWQPGTGMGPPQRWAARGSTAICAAQGWLVMGTTVQRVGQCGRGRQSYEKTRRSMAAWNKKMNRVEVNLMARGEEEVAHWYKILKNVGYLGNR